MSRKKSIKKHIKIGSLIETSNKNTYTVTELFENTFMCTTIYYDEYSEPELIRQVFNYNIDMTVYKKVASNCG